MWKPHLLRVFPPQKPPLRGLGLQDVTWGTLGPAPIRDTLMKTSLVNTYTRRQKRKRPKTTLECIFPVSGQHEQISTPGLCAGGALSLGAGGAGSMRSSPLRSHWNLGRSSPFYEVCKSLS